MIKAQAGDLLILELSNENIKRLKKGEPIVFDLKSNFLDQGIKRIFIFTGETEQSMEITLKKFIRPEMR